MNGEHENVLVLPRVGIGDRARLVPMQPRDHAEAELFMEKVQGLRAAAAADGHGVVAPTHVMVRGNGAGDGGRGTGEKIIGYLSLGGMMTVQAWFDSKSPHAADSLKMIEMGEAILQERGVRQYAIACAEESPFTPQMERLGFQKLGTTVLWVKELTR